MMPKRKDRKQSNHTPPLLRSWRSPKTSIWIDFKVEGGKTGDNWRLGSVEMEMLIVGRLKAEDLAHDAKLRAESLGHDVKLKAEEATSKGTHSPISPTVSISIQNAILHRVYVV